MSTGNPKNKKRDGSSSDELCDTQKKRATDLSGYEKYVNQENTESLDSLHQNPPYLQDTDSAITRLSSLECSNCKAEFGSWFGRCTACGRPEGCMCEETEESDEMCVFCWDFGRNPSKIPRNMVKDAMEEFCLSNWTGRCQGCGNRCCCMCLTNDTLLCKFCTVNEAKCYVCSNIVKKNMMISHPKCHLHYSDFSSREYKQGGCECCKNCAKINVETCPLCDRKANSDKKSSKIKDKDPYCCTCRYFMGYTGQYCRVCEKHVCFECIGDKEEICDSCNPMYIWRKTSIKKNIKT